MTESSNPPRPPTPAELAAIVRMLRDLRLWSQEQLASISGLSTRTIQRVENAKPSDLDTRRAIASAFGCEDIDVLNKPFVLPTAEEIASSRAKFERDHVTLQALPLRDARQLAALFVEHPMDLSTPGFAMERGAEVVFASLVDYLRDYRDCADVYSEVQKLEVFDELQESIDLLRSQGVSLRYAVRQLVVKISNEPTGHPASALYLICYRAGKEPDHFLTPRSVAMG